MRYLLDTNACIALLKGSPAPVVERLRQQDPSSVVVCAVVKAELLYGARHSERVATNLDRLARFFAAFQSLPFDDLAAEHAGAIRAELAATGKPIGPNDLLIAAIGRSRDLTVVTANTREFRRVVGLRVEDWAEGA